MNPDPVCIFIFSCLILSALCVWYASDMKDVKPPVDDGAGDDGICGNSEPIAVSNAVGTPLSVQQAYDALPPWHVSHISHAPEISTTRRRDDKGRFVK